MSDVAAQKADLRSRAFKRRRGLRNRDSRSEQIVSRISELPEYRSAESILFFIGVRSEVRTLPIITDELRGARQIVVPWCDGSELKLFRLKSIDDLAPGRWDIPEPTPQLRVQPDRIAAVCDLELILVPGVAFDRAGRRLGHGQGYYDRLLSGVPDGVPLVAPAFDCQLFNQIPVEPHDRRVDAVVTETQTIRPAVTP